MLKEKIQETNHQIKEKIQEARNEYTNQKKEREREKERERRKKGQRRFGQVKRRHSTMGIRSCRYAGGSAGLLLYCILISFLCGGKAGGIIGAFGIIAFLLAAHGIYAAIKGRRERDKNYITCRIGGICNGLLVLGMGIIFVGGLI
ncbi:MAG: DUF6142 family protein [Hespellia sp.]|nr:DUF6142 family protein [Hespellia sp.]